MNSDFSDNETAVEIEEIRIKELDINNVPPYEKTSSDISDGAKIVVIGKPGTGKSTIIKSLIYAKRSFIPIAQIFSGTEDSNKSFSINFPSLFIYNKLNKDKIKDFYKRQKIAIKYLDIPYAVQVLDDCTDDPKILRDIIFHTIFKNGRHYKMLFILSLQYTMDILPVLRNCIDGTFILRETNIKNRKNLFENYAPGCIKSFGEFCDILDNLTNDFTALYINNKSTSNNIEDCVFYYKADPNFIPKNWKFGCEDYWKFNNERLNKDYVEPIFS